MNSYKLRLGLLVLFALSALFKTDLQAQMSGIFDSALIIEEEETVSKGFLLVDDFEDPSKYNLLKGITNVYQMAPSRIMLSTVNDTRDGKETIALRLKFLRASEGGPYSKGGWCGYYSSLKEFTKTGTRYFSAVDYNYITMWIRSETGGVNFIIGLSDKHWDKAGDSVKCNEIFEYLPEKQITKRWQKAKIPLTAFLLDTGKLSSIAICFERECFPEGSGEGIVYIDDIAFE